VKTTADWTGVGLDTGVRELMNLNHKAQAVTQCLEMKNHTHTPQPFYHPFSGTTPVSQCQKRTSGLYGARED